MISVELGREIEQLAASWGFIASPSEVYEPIYQRIFGEMRGYDGQLGLVVTRKKLTINNTDSLRLNRYLLVLRSPFLLRSGSLMTVVTDKFYDYDSREPHIEYRRFGNIHPTLLPVQALDSSFYSISKFQGLPLEVVCGDANVYNWAVENNQMEPLMEMQQGLGEVKSLP